MAGRKQELSALNLLFHSERLRTSDQQPAAATAEGGPVTSLKKGKTASAVAALEERRTHVQLRFHTRELELKKGRGGRIQKTGW